MADFSTLIATLRATIKTNYNQEITGQILQDDLLAIVDAVNRLKQDTLEGYAFYGAPLANGASVAVTQNTFFLVGKGTYTINGISETTGEGIYVLVYDSVNDEVRNYALFAYDTEPTEDSRNAITSGAVFAALAQLATKAEVEAVEQEVAQVAGEAGLAEAVIDTDGAGTEQQFTFRKSGGDGGAYYRKIKGKTIVVDNQLASNDAEAVETTGANQWDEEWEVGSLIGNGVVQPLDSTRRTTSYIPILPNTSYYFTGPAGSGNGRIEYYDKAKNPIYYTSGYAPFENAEFVTIDGAYYMRMTFGATYGTTYNHDICINLSNPAINGQYFPYWKRTLQLGITTKKDTDGNVPFADGMKGAGTAADWADKVGGEKRMEDVDLGSLVWRQASYGFYSWDLASVAKHSGYSINPKYDANTLYIRDDGALICVDTTYADVATFTAAMAGVKLVFEKATPVPFTWAEPLNLGVKVDENGTEKAVAPEGATAPSAPFVADTTYTMSVARMVKKLQNL